MSLRWAALLLCGVACAGRGFVRYPAEEAAQVRDVHLYKGRPLCQGCHAGDTAALQAGPVVTCQRCHQARHTPGHEAGALLTGRPGLPLPLREGRIICTTCHDEHDVRRHRHGLRLDVNALCRSCHPGK